MFLHISVRKGPSGNETKVIQHKAKAVTFEHIGRTVKESNG